jgi:hypothetical protein
MQRALAWSVSVVVLAWTVSAHAAPPPSLKGNYAFTGTTGCLFAPGSGGTSSGFNSSLQPIVPMTSFSNSSDVEGIRTFNGDGTGSVTATEVGFTAPPTPSFPPAGESSNFQFSFTYAFNLDGSFTANLTGTFSGTFLTGPRSGQTYTIDVLQLVGYPSKGSATLTLASQTPIVETITYSDGTAIPRICHRSRVLIAQ